MLELRYVRSNKDKVRQNLSKRGENAIRLLDEALKLDKIYRDLIKDVETLRAEKNKISLRIANISKLPKEKKTTKEKPEKSVINKLIEKARLIDEQLKSKEQDLAKIGREFRKHWKSVPNILMEDVPIGEDEKDNKVLRFYNKKPVFKFKPRSHVELLKVLGMADLQRAAKVSGARFYYLLGDLVLLDLALIRFAIDFLRSKGFKLVEPPFMMQKKPYQGVTDLEAFNEMLYKIDKEDLYLIATSEHPMAAMFMNEVLNGRKLPLKLVGVSPCFRKEAGSHGKDTKGIFRVHQFNKVEQFVFSRQEESISIHEELINNAEELFKKLGLHYRVVNVCTGDLGSVAAKKYDIEAWLPAQQAYREVVSCSNCLSYQAVRLNIKYDYKGARKYVHTLNSTAIATQRAIVAILENYQLEDGSVEIPKALRNYMPVEVLTPLKH